MTMYDYCKEDRPDVKSRVLHPDKPPARASGSAQIMVGLCSKCYTLATKDKAMRAQLSKMLEADDC